MTTLPLLEQNEPAALPCFETIVNFGPESSEILERGYDRKQHYKVE
jgi:hypothetical protein